MKTLKTIIALGILTLSTAACSQNRTYSSGMFGGKVVKASKNYVTKDIRVSDFTGLSLSGSPDVIYTQQAGKPKVEVYTSDNIADLLDISVTGQTLNVKFKKGVNVSYDKLEIRISSATLDKIHLAGSGDVKLTNGLKTDNLNISVAGSGDIQGSNITCTSLTTSVTGSGDLKLNGISTDRTEASITGSGTTVLRGTTREANYRVTGSGDLSASDLQAKHITANVAGSGDIKCHATEHLKARISGSGRIGYKGNPELDVPKKGIHKL